MSEVLAVVVPAYNEAKTVANTIRAIAGDQNVPPDALIAVDNNSTDDTAQIITDLQLEYPTLHLVSEDTKGTGAACRTGFRYAIDELGATIIARTDADSIPRRTWCGATARYFVRRPDKVSVAGITTFLRDEFFLPRYYRTPINSLAFRGISSVKRHSLWPLTATYGHNMAVRAEAYDAVGGSAPTKIEESDEDIELFHKIYSEHGIRGTGFNPFMVVASSQRRTRRLGAQIARYYDDLEPGLTQAQRAQRQRRLAILEATLILDRRPLLRASTTIV